jgi:hypothetical protein
MAVVPYIRTARIIQKLEYRLAGKKQVCAVRKDTEQANEIS